MNKSKIEKAPKPPTDLWALCSIAIRNFGTEKAKELGILIVGSSGLDMYVVVHDNFDWIAMDILREFLETSTIHGLTYISSARVSFCWVFYLFTISFCPDQIGKGSLVFNCLSRVHWGWNPDWQVLQGLAGEPYRHLDHHPPHRWPGLPHCDRLSSEELQHCPLPWSCQGWQWTFLWQTNIKRCCL